MQVSFKTTNKSWININAQCLILTLINSAEEDIEEYTDKQRAHGHLPAEG